MPPDESQLDYAPPGLKNPGSGRSVGTWIKLLLVWAIGLVIWTVYLIALAYLVIRIL